MATIETITGERAGAILCTSYSAGGRGELRIDWYTTDRPHTNRTLHGVTPAEYAGVREGLLAMFDTIAEIRTRDERTELE